MFERFRKDEAAGFELSIYLPHDYGKVRERYPVVYVQDDGNVVRSGFNYIDHLVMTKRLPKMIFVGVKPHNRNDDYTPWPARALLPGQPDFGGGAGHYLRALAEQIKPHVDAAYPTGRSLRTRELPAALSADLSAPTPITGTRSCSARSP
ncbi:hypothetical protein PACILC2_53610 [Paenibacillus cisolokensis]|uniref:Esterase n=1 Tax=Paenibacillus cisolokensis TaxID=1658519 RepID=A0ABQ4NEY0_9BACL|nr:alpha/beta hydrolase-fold protein [Paenibacillus cisolokensis]GIQ66793.1 hypothetical protein PACILC2_53610 [Paenibacillus cisolokensis]